MFAHRDTLAFPSHGIHYKHDKKQSRPKSQDEKEGINICRMTAMCISVLKLIASLSTYNSAKGALACVLL